MASFKDFLGKEADKAEKQRQRLNVLTSALGGADVRMPTDQLLKVFSKHLNTKFRQINPVLRELKKEFPEIVFGTAHATVYWITETIVGCDVDIPLIWPKDGVEGRYGYRTRSGNSNNMFLHVDALSKGPWFINFENDVTPFAERFRIVVRKEEDLAAGFATVIGKSDRRDHDVKYMNETAKVSMDKLRSFLQTSWVHTHFGHIDIDKHLKDYMSKTPDYNIDMNHLYVRVYKPSMYDKSNGIVGWQLQILCGSLKKYGASMNINVPAK